MRTLMCGVSGLKSQAKKMEVLSNNLANLTTVGYKKNRVTFQDLYYDVLKNASQGDGDNIGGTNPQTLGTGVEIGAIDTIFTQGARQNTARSLDFMVDGDDFFVLMNSSGTELMLSRAGAFQLDGNMNLVDNLGNMVQGFNIDPNTGVEDSEAQNIVIDTGPMDPNATTEVKCKHNISSASAESNMVSSTEAWKIFSGGENYGDFDIAISSGAGLRSTYGSGHYQDSVIHSDSTLTLISSTDTDTDRRFVALTDSVYQEDNTLTSTTALTISDTTGFAAGDVVTVSQINSTTGALVQEEAYISSLVANTSITFGSALESSFTTSAANVMISKAGTSDDTMSSGATLNAALNTLTVTSATGWNVGDVVKVNQVVGTELMQTTANIAGISGTTVTLGSTMTGFTASTADVTIYKVLDKGFAANDYINVRQGSGSALVQDKVRASTVSGGIIALTGQTLSTFTEDAATITGLNLTDGTASIGSSGSSSNNDILHSQISMVDQYGGLIASFYRVGNTPAEYSRATATDMSGNTFTIGTGEFNSWYELKELMERALKDNELEHHEESANMDIGIDKYGKISFGGTGQVSNFRVVVNADNTSLQALFGDIALTDADTTIATQARVNENGAVIDYSTSSTLSPSRTVDATTYWFDSSTGIENYGYSSTAPSTGYGEYAGLRMDGGANGYGFGTLSLSLTNALGNSASAEFIMVAKDADLDEGEFSTMGELAQLVQTQLRTSTFSSVADNGSLVADETVTVTVDNGRLKVTTTEGSFNGLTLTPNNQDSDSGSGITLTDYQNFGTVLGEFIYGINGKQGISNKFIQADSITQTSIYDNKGNQHTAVTYLVHDRSAGLTNTEWKYKTGLNPNLNTFVTNNPDNKYIYRDTYNSLQDTSSSRGVIGFDIDSGRVLSSDSTGADSRYKDEGELKFTPEINGSQIANTSDIDVTFTDLTSYNGENTIVSTNEDGYAMGSLVRLSTEQNTGVINGVYSNGKVTALAKLGLMAIANPEGLEKVGTNLYAQTVNSSGNGNIKGVDQVYAVNATPPAGIDSVTSKIHGSALEASNVDLTEELTEMITTQRAYSAAGKTISSADELLQEALSLKR